jgi:exonuclease VII large subunit
MDVEHRARAALAIAKKDMITVNLPLQTVSQTVRTKTRSVRAWRQRRRDRAALEAIEKAQPEVRQCEEELRLVLQQLNDAKHQHKNQLAQSLQVMKMAFSPFVELFEYDTSVLRRCIDELSCEATRLKAMISFWEEILKQRRLECISKGMAFSHWAHMDRMGHANVDSDLSMLHARLQSVRKVRDRRCGCTLQCGL